MAPYFGIDDWPVRLERQRREPARQFYSLMQTDRRDRIEQVLELARAQLDFDVIGAGPTMSLGIGKEFEDDTELGMVIQDLKPFPGMGWDLLRIGLHNRVCGVRNMSISVLEIWEKGHGRQTPWKNCGAPLRANPMRKSGKGSRI